MTDRQRPRLRPVESVIVPDERFGRALMLRDTEGVTQSVAVVPAPLIPIVARFDGKLTITEIAAAVAAEAGAQVPVELVESLAAELDQALLLDSPRYRAERKRVRAEFAGAEVRPAAHAGGAYHAEPTALRRYLDDNCLSKAVPPLTEGATMRALVAPHIDPWRGAVGYGHAYAALRASLPKGADTFVLLGTSHAPMREPFALCRKSFETPLGPVEADTESIDALAEQASFDPYADLLNHKREHSLEFQAVFVRHLMNGSRARIVPILCGLGESQASGRDPALDSKAETFVSALRGLCERLGDRAVIVAGADLAHVGPRFGDGAPYDQAQREGLEATDRESLGLLTEGRAREFFFHVQRDLDTRRVCGLGPIYTLMRVVPASLRGTVHHYEQTVDADEGSIVSHAAVGLYS